MEYPVPVVRLIISDPEGRVLILRRAHSEYASGQWCLPGGKIDYGDTIEKTVEKELREETSLSCLSMKYLFYQDSLPLSEGKMHCINLYFECTVAGEIVLNEESSEFTWIGPADMEWYQIAFRHDFGLRRFWQGKGEGDI
jgi:8-oxo-dGTP pyrophosphatase MutT (NUDIX family)